MTTIKDLEKEIKQLKLRAANEALALALLQEVDLSSQDKEWLNTRLAPAFELLGIRNSTLKREKNDTSDKHVAEKN